MITQQESAQPAAVFNYSFDRAQCACRSSERVTAATGTAAAAAGRKLFYCCCSISRQLLRSITLSDGRSLSISLWFVFFVFFPRLSKTTFLFVFVSLSHSLFLVSRCCRHRRRCCCFVVVVVVVCCLSGMKFEVEKLSHTKGTVTATKLFFLLIKKHFTKSRVARTFFSIFALLKKNTLS